jgi:adenosylcobinamide-phosphate synthase
VTPFDFETRLWMLAAALVLDGWIGDPDWLWRRLPHPVAWFGALIDRLDLTLNRDSASSQVRRATGVFAVFVLVAVAWFAGVGIEHGLSQFRFGYLLVPLIGSVLLAARSLHDHVQHVGSELSGGLAAGRIAVSRIVGRDPDSLDESGVARAAIESTAENFSDGVVAPALWFALLGLPGLIAYKAINTADSMIGHRSTRHEAFGWAAARLDDLVNLPASRLSGLLIALAAPFAGGEVRTAFVTMLDDAGKHRSPNAGWPEAAMAGALGIALAGPRRYDERVVDDPFLNDSGRRVSGAGDIRRALRILVAATALGVALTVILALWLQV